MEIGSEYWKYEGKLDCDNSNFWNIGKDTKFTLSGRTAIYFVLKNILEKQNIKKVYFPAYSCTSMAQAFIDLGIEIEYYDVYYNEELKYNIDLENDSDIFFAMNYFGYSSSNMDEYIKYFKARKKIIIEDITHSILSGKRYSTSSDYLVGSLRKWLPISSGGIAVNLNEKFIFELSKNTNEELINLKQTAMENKRNYLEHVDSNEKNVFLNQYSESNKLLNEDYKNYLIDDESLKIIMGIDLKKIINSRFKNADLIYEKLKNNINVKFLFSKRKENDCLLFVPIILEHNLRDSVRKHLIENEVYLPVHWPLEEKINNIFDKELSLICDQRYTTSQIEEYLNLILDFLKERT